MNPVAPSAVVIGAQSDEAGDPGAVWSTTGKPENPGNGKPENPGNGNGNGNGNQPTVPPGQAPPSNTTPTTTGKVEIEGLISAKTGDAITVNAQKVVVPPTTRIRHGSTPFTFADLNVGDRVHVRASRTTTGSGATAVTTLEATEVMLQNPGDAVDAVADQPTDLVSVAAFDDVAVESPVDAGTFRLTRTGTATRLAAPLTVTFSLTGTATNGVDYPNVPLTATFLAGLATVDVLVTPRLDAAMEGPESVILTLTGVAPYDLGAPETATVTITDRPLALVSVTAHDSTAAETPLNPGTFRFSRTSVAGPLVVTFTISGTATNGTDYQSLTGTVTFLSGIATVDLQVRPLADAVAEGTETVTVTITDSASYDVGAPSVATVTISG